jgi:CRP/FNR family cyclic AMP-dependent transcriptional regulator
MTAPPRKSAVGGPDLALKSVPFFTQLNDEELEVARSLAIEKSYPRNAVVLTEGEQGDSLFMIEAGRVKVFIGDEDGREIILKILGPGQFFGEMSMVDQQPRSASVTTLEPATFLILSHASFEAAVQKKPRIANLVLRVLAQRLRDADRKIGTLALMDVYGRVASTLLELAVHVDGKLVIREKLSQQEIANMVGASREMVNRVLKDLSERGFIAVESKSITIINRELPSSL